MDRGIAITADLEYGARICHEPVEQDNSGKANSANEQEKRRHGEDWVLS